MSGYRSRLKRSGLADTASRLGWRARTGRGLGNRPDIRVWEAFGCSFVRCQWLLL